MNRRKQLIVALDGLDPDESLALLERLEGVVGCFKVGPALFAAGGEALLGAIGDRGLQVFLDLKLHDIPETVFRAVRRLARPPVRFLTVHALGGPEMLRRAVAGARGVSWGSTPPTRILAVTILTSLRQEDLDRIGISRPIEEETVHLATLARQCGLDGVVCSGQESRAIRNACGRPFLILTPGIRPGGAPADDQARTVEPGEAVRRGADCLIVGRPILGAPDPRKAAEAIAAEMETATAGI